MDNNFKNIDDKFRDAFDSWEADFSPAEMKADWSQLSAKIAPPQAPVTQPLSKPFWSAGKMLGLVSSAAVLTTAGVLLFNTYIYDGEKIPSLNNPSVVAENNKTTPADETQTANTPNIIADDILAGDDDKAFPNHDIYRNNKTGNNSTNTAQSGDNGNIPFTGNDVNTQPSSNGNNPITLNNTPNLPFSNNGNDNTAGSEGRKVAGSISKKELIYSDTVFCLGKVLTVSFTGANMPEAAIIEWGDGEMQPLARTNKHLYNKPGSYRIRVADGNKVLEKIIKVIELPVASFTNFDCDKMKCKFRNTSKQAYSYVWNFGDGTPAVYTSHPEHQFNDTGRYFVTLAAYTTAGCVDSIVQQIRVTSFTKPYIPNVLTPNGDGDNDFFTVKISDESLYYIKIMDLSTDRLVFESKDKNQPWDGTLFNQGTACNEGRYYYIITYKFGLLDPIREDRGFVTLRR